MLLARHGSLSAAARAHDLTPPAATRRLVHMEGPPGVRLVNRTTRSVSLTSEGETYLLHATRILAEVRELSARDPRAILGTQPSPHLRPTAPRRTAYSRSIPHRPDASNPAPAPALGIGFMPRHRAILSSFSAPDKNGHIFRTFGTS
ncbi:LysR family transcriptional regulator [Paraburkholderia sediminicola]|uniref:LysR family transcriptional regulator n=1 Tax=Paraburkholderia sediminicola TaxID=458836 RepID=UPI0038B924D0